MKGGGEEEEEEEEKNDKLEVKGGTYFLMDKNMDKDNRTVREGWGLRVTPGSVG